MFGLAAATAMLAAVSHVAVAAEFIAPQNDSGSVVIGAGETHRNVYTAGQSVTINTGVEGDLFAAGSSVLVNGAADDINVAGGDININAGARGDIRVMGGTAVINGQVGGDVIIAGGTVRLVDTASIAGDLVVAGGEVIVDAPVAGKVKIAGGKVRLNSKLGGEVKIRAEELVIGSRADIANKISYKGQKDAQLEDGNKINGIDFEKVEKRSGPAKHFARIATIGFVMKLLAGIAAAILLMKLFPRTTENTVAHIQSHPWSNLGIGFLGMIIIPICALILLVTFVGYYIAALAFFGYILVLLIACVAASIFIGALAIKLLTKKPNLVVDWQAIVIGVVVVGILRFIPVIGWLAVAIVSMMAFGALLRMIKNRIDQEQGSGEAAPQLPLNN